jgi:UPF0271 protein
VSASIDLNADLGEGFGPWRMGDDDALLGIVSSANVACGFHAGDPLTMARVCASAAANGVRVGAHVCWRDLEGFGRRDLQVAPDQLHAELVNQIGALVAHARVAGTAVTYVKPHGMLYNRAFADRDTADAIVRAVADVDRSLVVLTQPGSAVLELARAAGLPVAAEGFADRAYLPTGQLMPRSRAGSMLGVDAAVAQAVRLAEDRTVATEDGDLPMDVATICLHGDSPDAVDLARRIRAALEAGGTAIRPFT